MPGVMLLPPEGGSFVKLSKLPAFIYLALVSISFIVCMGEGRWGIGTSFSLLLTLPWSMTMVIFMWAIAHDGARSLLIFLIPFAGLNFFLLYKIPNWLKKARESGGNPAA
jgi:hypothetical protein